MVTCVWASGELTRLRLVCLGGAPRSAVLFSPPSHILCVPGGPIRRVARLCTTARDGMARYSCINALTDACEIARAH